MKFEKIIVLNLKLDNTALTLVTELQGEYLKACKDVCQLAFKNNCWARVPLHHLAYKGIRAKYPKLGSQLICNAIYMASRFYKLSKLHSLSKTGYFEDFPEVYFSNSAPVFLDWHTVSITEDKLSLYTLSGRLHVNLSKDVAVKILGMSSNIKQILLMKKRSRYCLCFMPKEVSDGLDFDILISGKIVKSSPNILEAA